jgi:hypothetical protein
MLRESTRNWLLQLAIDKVKNGIDPDPDELYDEERRECFERNVANLEQLRDELGPEQFQNMEIDLGYSY